MKARDEIVAEATFDPKLKLYMTLNGAWILLLTVVGIPLIPFWFIVGPMWARRYFERLSCRLTPRSLIVKRGVLVRSEKTVPLDKIQDFSLTEGPILRKLGLAKLKIETAGQSAQGEAEAALIGVVGVYEFRDRVLTERDRVVERLAEGGRTVMPSEPAHSSPIESGGADSRRLLTDIHETLQRIEEHLRTANSRG